MSLAAFLPQREGDNSLIWREMTPANIAEPARRSTLSANNQN
jgi:hypothetical protein